MHAICILFCISTFLVAIHTEFVDNLSSVFSFVHPGEFSSIWNMPIVMIWNLVLLSLPFLGERCFGKPPTECTCCWRFGGCLFSGDFWQSCDLNHEHSLSSNEDAFVEFSSCPGKEDPFRKINTKVAVQRYPPGVQMFIVSVLLTFGWGMDMSLTAVTRPHFVRWRYGQWATPLDNTVAGSLKPSFPTLREGENAPSDNEPSRARYSIPFRRVGEAKCPGPQQRKDGLRKDFDKWFLPQSPSSTPSQSDSDEASHLLQISIANPTSINGRSHEVCSWDKVSISWLKLLAHN